MIEILQNNEKEGTTAKKARKTRQANRQESAINQQYVNMGILVQQNNKSKQKDIAKNKASD